jgi:hypothetical protein
MSRKRASTVNDLDIGGRKRETAVDILNAYGGLEEEAEEQEIMTSNKPRAVSVDIIRERNQMKPRSGSFDVAVDDFLKTLSKRRKSESRASSVDILNAYGGFEEADEYEED